jgi:hypothetical protein
MSYNLFLDDQRNPEDAYLADSHMYLLQASHATKWEVVRTYEEFVECINRRGIPDRVSFDHDLHFEHIRYFVEHTMTTGYIEYANFTEKTGKHCADFLVNRVFEIDYPAPICYVHTANHIGRKEIRKSLFRIAGNNITS